MTDNVVPGTFTDNYTSRNRVTRPPMYTHGGFSFPRAVTLFGQGRRVSRASFQSLVPRSGSSFLVPVPRSSFLFLAPRSGSLFLVPGFVPVPRSSFQLTDLSHYQRLLSLTRTKGHIECPQH